MDRAGDDRYAALTPGPSVEGLVILTIRDGEWVPLRRWGTLCANAKDARACEERAKRLLVSGEQAWSVTGRCPGALCNQTVEDCAVISRGGDVGSVGIEELRAAALPIDSADEAAIFLTLDGRRLDCDSNNVRSDPNGWLFRLPRCQLSEPFVKVTREGAIVDIVGCNVAAQ